MECDNSAIVQDMLFFMTRNTVKNKKVNSKSMNLVKSNFSNKYYVIIFENSDVFIIIYKYTDRS